MKWNFILKKLLKNLVIIKKRRFFFFFLFDFEKNKKTFLWKKLAIWDIAREYKKVQNQKSRKIKKGENQVKKYYLFWL